MASPERCLCNGRRSPLPNQKALKKRPPQGAPVILTPQMVTEFLAQYPAVLENYVLEFVPEKQLKDLLDKKRKVVKTKKKTMKPRMPFGEIGVVDLSRRLSNCIEEKEINDQFFTITETIAEVLKADTFTLYIVCGKDAHLSIFNPRNLKEPIKRVGPTGKKMTVSAHVASEKQSENVVDLPQDARFPKGVGFHNQNAHFVVCLPILNFAGSTMAVVEFVRGWENNRFSEFEFGVANLIYGWVSTCAQKIRLNSILETHSKLNTFLLETTKEIFDNIDNIDLLVKKIMVFTKNLVNADRCALFLVDEDRHELFADFFDEGKKDSTGFPLITKTSQIRFPDNKGIAGYVSKTGKTVNIIDAYSDPRFNPEVDRKTGYKTNNILCMPIVKTDGVIGVVQMVNKVNGPYFSDEDVKTFDMFAVYCALALHYCRIYNMLAHQQTKYKVAMEVLQFHIKCNEDDVEVLLNKPHVPEESVPERFQEFSFYCNDYAEILPQLFIKMVINCFGEKTFVMEKLCRFILTVRKNYRPVTYHNWEHGFQVAHCLWLMIKKSKFVFTNLEKLSLIIGGICHDLDHRGYNNDFFKKLKLPLADLYTTSVMEEHHYKQTVTILHADGHDIFSFMTADQHRILLDMIKKRIIATDLARYFDTQKFLKQLLDSDSYDPNDTLHREKTLSMMMTAADLCAVPKPWETQKKNVYLLYQEFFTQGDEEKKRGITPIPMMDRSHEDDIPQQQIGFINFICMPMYTTLYRLLPETKPLLTMCITNTENWENVVAENKAKKASTST